MNKIVIQKLVPSGQGLATLPDGKKAFFWNALPGETVTEYQVTKNKSHYLEAIATEIEQPSPHRIAPLDPHFLSTSPWQIMDYAYELKQKSLVLKESLPNLDINQVITDGKDFFYRNKMEYSLYYAHEDQQIHLAVHQRGSHRKIPIKQSSLELPAIFHRAENIVAELNANGEEARKYQSILLRANQKGEVSGGLFKNGHPHPTFPELTDTILGYEYSYSPNGFFQINLPVYELALQEIEQHIQTEQVLDLYAGVGTIGLSVARDHQLTLVETDKFAFSELERNCLGEHFVAGRTERGSASSSAGSPWRRASRTRPETKWSPKAILSNSEDALDFVTPHTTVILDPPRAGCHPKLLEKILQVCPPTVIYLSCNPATQARDLQILSKKYQPQLVQPYNFFPRTPHLENLVILRLKSV